LEIYSKFRAYIGLYKGRQDEYLGQLLNLNLLFVTLLLYMLWLYIFLIFTLILNIFGLIIKFYWYNWRTVDRWSLPLEY